MEIPYQILVKKKRNPKKVQSEKTSTSPAHLPAQLCSRARRTSSPFAPPAHSSALAGIPASCSIAAVHRLSPTEWGVSVTWPVCNSDLGTVRLSPCPSPPLAPRPPSSYPLPHPPPSSHSHSSPSNFFAPPPAAPAALSAPPPVSPTPSPPTPRPPSSRPQQTRPSSLAAGRLCVSVSDIGLQLLQVPCSRQH